MDSTHRLKQRTLASFNFLDQFNLFNLGAGAYPDVVYTLHLRHKQTPYTPIPAVNLEIINQSSMNDFRLWEVTQRKSMEAMGALAQCFIC